MANPCDAETIAVLILVAFMGVVNLGLTALNFKLYTEFFKQRIQESRGKEMR